MSGAQRTMSSLTWQQAVKPSSTLAGGDPSSRKAKTPSVGTCLNEAELMTLRHSLGFVILLDCKSKSESCTGCTTAEA